MNRWSWLRWGGRLLGRLLDCVSWTPKRLSAEPKEPWSEERLRRVVDASPRANGYLSLEPGLRLFGSDEGVISWAGWRQTAFAVGGLHGPDAANSYQVFRRQAQEAGYRRVLAFPVADRERSALAEVWFRSLMVGSEAFVDPVEFSLKGGRRADLRQMVNRGRHRHGLVVEETGAQGLESGMQEIYERWLSSRSVDYRMRLLI
ncbi:MAG: phosphatidylglycerol lysyltransferase domain-containing protein, partial [Myxococcota bacterium]|nr:phosphatidylglycerol lysyltransferase domain-containing protein [Myxococcota bacterium]